MDFADHFAAAYHHDTVDFRAWLCHEGVENGGDGFGRHSFVFGGSARQVADLGMERGCRYEENGDRYCKA